MSLMLINVLCRCWTQGKPDKLVYLRKSSMWYLTEECSPLEALIEAPFAPGNDRRKTLPAGEIYKFSQTILDRPILEQWDALGNRCCMSMPNAP